MRRFLLTDNVARLLIYQAFVEGRIKSMPRYLLPIVHDNYFSPEQDEFRPRSLSTLSNAFTSAFKQLAPIRHFEVTAKLGSYLKEFQNDWNSCETNNIQPMVDCGTDLNRFDMPDEIRGIRPDRDRDDSRSRNRR